MTTNNPSIQQDNALLLTCLARQILADYPAKLERSKFYALWERHHGKGSADRLISLVALEHRNFSGWCRLEGIPASWTNVRAYLAENPAKVLQPAFLPPEPPPCPPWWSDMPWLAPVAASGVSV